MADSNVISLEELRRKKTGMGRKSALPLETRIEELEQDQVRLIDLAMDMERRLFRQERYISKLVRLLAASASEASEGPDPEGQ